MANEKFVSNVMPRIPMPRFGEPEDFKESPSIGQQGFIPRRNHPQ
jgi:hypothetical protein